MEFHKLDLSKALIIKREVDIVLQKLALYNNNINFSTVNSINSNNTSIGGVTNSLNNNNNNEINKNKLYNSIQIRVYELDQFCEQYYDDERIILFEKEKLRLRKALQLRSTDERSVSGSNPTSLAGTSIQSRPNTIDTLNASTATAGTSHIKNSSSQARTYQQPSNNTVLPSTVNKSIYSSNNFSLNNTSVIKSTPSIYAWEDGNNIKKRENIEMNGLVYKPTRELGFYSVGNSQDLSFGNDRYIDFQIILTDEELTTLAARTKASRVIIPSHITDHSKSVATSVHTSTPYIDPKRIFRDMLRPNNPDKWLHPDGMRPYQKRSMNLKS